jgi:hypothetical protein
MAFKSNDQRRRARLRRGSRKGGEANPITYEDQDGQEQKWQGDKEAPWVKVVNQATLATEVHGNIEHDDPDAPSASSKPLKIGGHATAGLRAPVDEDDRVDGSYDLEGRMRVLSTLSPLSLSRDSTAALAETKVVKAAAGRLYQLQVTRSSPGNLFYLQLHDLAAAPAPAAVPVYSVPLPGSGAAGWQWDQGSVFSTGIVWVVSTTIATYTAVGASIAFGTAEYS